MSISLTFYAHFFRTKCRFSSYVLGFVEKFERKIRAFNVDEIDGRNRKKKQEETRVVKIGFENIENRI